MATGIELTAKHSPLAWLLYFTKLTVSVDGSTQVLKWGTHSFDTSPGTHKLEVSFGYIGKQRGPAALDVPVTEGQITRVSYSSPLLMTAPGKMKISA